MKLREFLETIRDSDLTGRLDAELECKYAGDEIFTPENIEFDRLLWKNDHWVLEWS